MNCEYNDHVCPALPEGAPEDHPYGLILYIPDKLSFLLLYADAPYFVKTVDDAQVIALRADTQLYAYLWTITDADWGAGTAVDASQLEVAQNEEWLYFLPDKTVYVWTGPDDDICDENGNVVYAASDPIPIIETDYLMSWLTGYILGISGKPYPFRKAQKWETVFDEEVTTSVHIGTPGSAFAAFFNAFIITEGTTFRLTVDGVPFVGVATPVPGKVYTCVGNVYLIGGNNYEDIGYDFCLCDWDYSESTPPVRFYTRTPGTYKLKVERLVE